MKFPVLEIENFLSIGNAKVSLDGQGLVGVAGENKDDSSADSNGTGKSSLVDALSWCLWGSTARGISGDDVVSWNLKRGQGTRVATTIDDNGDRYQVVRHRKYPKHKHSLQLFKEDNGQWVDLTKGTTALTQAQIERLLGCSEEVFNAAVYSGQEAMPDIPNMTDKQLKLLVEQAAGVDVLSNAYDIARERARKASETRSSAQVAYDRANERLTDAHASLTQTEASAVQWDQTQAANIEGYKQDTVRKTAEFNQAKAQWDDQAGVDLDIQIAAVKAKIDAVGGERQREASLQTVYNTTASTYASAKANLDRAEQELARLQRSAMEP
jgi:DNA repair exonuclease SbcCD ATPase subunit